MVESSKKVKPWRADVVQVAKEAIALTPGFTPYTGPVAVVASFFLPRPLKHYGTGRNDGIIKPGAPVYIQAKPDIDKLIRSTFDGLTTAGVWGDDNQVARITATKRYVNAETAAGVWLCFSALQVTP
jgi:crossover junction endodeoxyribonuclease RusA